MNIRIPDDARPFAGVESTSSRCQFDVGAVLAARRDLLMP
jgi:hypothetical protein